MTGPFAFLRRLFGRDEPMMTWGAAEAMAQADRAIIRAFLLWVKGHDDLTDADLHRVRGSSLGTGARLALRHGYADDGTAGLPFYRVTPKGERFLQEFER